MKYKGENLMGIPSYFRKILQRYPGCLQSTVPEGVAALVFDFNCLIYRCLRQMPEYKEEFNDSWEQTLLHEINGAVKEIWKMAGSPAKVFLAVDGVVPMAKIRQQRMRRFKSAWLRQKGLDGRGGWDSNAITPGTLFMEKLTSSLAALCASHKGWSLSSVSEKGEGEHKVMNWIRERKDLLQGGSIIVYGLDADLILLSMLTGEQTGKHMWLLREKQEFGGGAKKLDGEQEYQFMNLEEFQQRLGVKGEAEVIQYIALMNLMGNDFLPHSITHKLNDDGHDFVLKELKAGVCLVNSENKLDLKVFRDVCKRWSCTEADKMLQMIKKKKDQAKRGVLEGMSEEEGLPLKWMVEKCLLNEDFSLLSDWRDMYWQEWMNKADRDNLCAEYVKGFQWILDYYQGRAVNSLWMYPASLPPLWSDLANWKVDRGVGAAVLQNESEYAIQPKEQLAMVLPLESWGLIRDPVLKGVPRRAPQFWPEEFDFFSAGRKWLWECEAIIPPLPIQRLRQFVQK